VEAAAALAVAATVGDADAVGDVAVGDTGSPWNVLGSNAEASTDATSASAGSGVTFQPMTAPKIAIMLRAASQAGCLRSDRKRRVTPPARPAAAPTGTADSGRAGLGRSSCDGRADPPESPSACL
jgi:hypothetical protein